jgi:hypothetical protein
MHLRSTQLTSFDSPALAGGTEAALFGRNPDGSGRCTGRLLGQALCQCAALHYVNGKNGVKEFNVWSLRSV